MSQQTASPDLSIPSYAGAAHFAREAAEANRRAAGRTIANAEDRRVGEQTFVNLLWHVGAEHGGFMGRSDNGLVAHCKRLGLSIAMVREACWAPGNWPVSKKEAA